jgi:hypothetical protein
MSRRTASIAVALALAAGGLAAVAPRVDIPAKESWEAKVGLVERVGDTSKGGHS